MKKIKYAAIAYFALDFMIKFCKRREKTLSHCI